MIRKQPCSSARHTGFSPLFAALLALWITLPAMATPCQDARGIVAVERDREQAGAAAEVARPQIVAGRALQRGMEHGGDLRLSSVPGDTRFVVRLPLHEPPSGLG